ncbi:zinc finger protein [Salix suchowensis]|nr:zinc finger protein [Salix suchowensis]
MTAGRKAENAMGGRTARACDSCLRKRARWFCVADDAFLCQACDASVHSANQLASRHHRVRLETASSSYRISGSLDPDQDYSPPAWHQGFTRKARTPRHNSNKSLLVQQLLKDDREKVFNPLPLVPEIGSEEEANRVADGSEDDQFLCRVPVFDPFAATLCDTVTAGEVYGQEGTCDLDSLPGFLPSDIDLAEFAADVENMLGREADKEYHDTKDSGLLDCSKEEDEGQFCFSDKVVKIKDEQEMEAVIDCHFDQDFNMARESLMDWNFDYEKLVDGDEEVEEKKLPVPETVMMNSTGYKEMKRNVSLRLDYESVIIAWANQGCPWTTGSRPELNPDDSWTDSMGACPKDGSNPYGGLGSHTRGGDGEREARVMRYKEKRRTRLFSKKIRYEVRKLNAEKRPRMKGRFVKRASLMGTADFPLKKQY